MMYFPYQNQAMLPIKALPPPNKLNSQVFNMRSIFLKAIPLLILIFFLNIFSSAAAALDSLTWKKLEKEQSIEKWLYIKKGDSLQWALPSYDESHWDNLFTDSAKTAADSVYEDYFGSVWLRTHIWVDSSLTNKLLALNTSLLGACEVYLDGKLIQSIGTLGINGKEEKSGFTVKPNPYPFYFDRPGEHLLAYRITNFSEKQPAYYVNFSSQVDVVTINSEISRLSDELHDLTDFSNESKILVFSGIFITLTLFHFVLFLYYRKNKTNLFYSLFTLFLTIIFFGAYQIMSGTDLQTTQEIMVLEMAAIYLAPLFFLALLYQVFYKRLLAIFWILAGMLVSAGYLIFMTDFKKLGGFFAVGFIFTGMIETIRVYLRAWLKKKDGAGIFLLGILLPPVGTLILWIISGLIGKLGYSNWEENLSALLGQFFGYSLLLSVSISMTIYLARDFARMNKKLQQQLREIKQLFEKTIVQESERKRILENQNIELEQKVTERTTEVMHQKAEIEIKNRDILDNLNYARRIQSAILPDIKLIYETLKDSFIFYRPKDIVSGDFYTFSQKENRVIISSADCTGHGVTGAFMSMIGSSHLNQIINERGILRPSEILNHLNTGITEALKQTDKEVNDGMDIALCSLDLQNLRLEYAGANRPLWLFRNSEWIEIKPDKLPIGGFRVNREAVFTNHEMELRQGDTIYLFTDGFADQFGGPDGKKILSKRFREILLSMQTISMQDQKKKLESFFDEWKKNTEQVDDVLVIGIRI